MLARAYTFYDFTVHAFFCQDQNTDHLQERDTRFLPGEESCKEASRRSSLARRCLMLPPVDWRTVAKKKCAPEIRGLIKRLWIRASSVQSLPLYPLYHWRGIGDGKPSPFQTLSVLLDKQKRASLCAVIVTSQPKHMLQGSGCAADRASRSDDETAREVTDRACSYLASPTLFH